MGEPRSWEHLQQPEEHLRQRSSGSSGEEGGLGDAEARPGGGGHGQGLHRRTGPCREDGGDGVSGRMVELLVDSVVETQRRMMDRRGEVLSRAFEALIRRTFTATAGERRKAGVVKGKLS